MGCNCSAWHRIPGLGRYTNATPRYADGFIMDLTRERWRAIQKDTTGKTELDTINELKKHFPKAQEGRQFVKVYSPKGEWYLLGAAKYIEHLEREAR